MYLSICCNAIPITLSNNNLVFKLDALSYAVCIDLQLKIEGMCSKCNSWEEFYYDENTNLEQKKGKEE